MLFWYLTVGLFIIASLFVLLPLWMHSRAEADDAGELRRNQNIALFQERHDELTAELAAGNVEQDQFDALLLELQRSLLADVEPDAPPQAAGRKQGKRKNGQSNYNAFLPDFLVIHRYLTHPYLPHLNQYWDLNRNRVLVV